MSRQSSELGDYKTAIYEAEQGLALARKIGDRSGKSWALTYLGRSCHGVGELEQATEAFYSALVIRQELKQPALATEPQAGLALTFLAAGNLPAARQTAQGIMTLLKDPDSLDGTDDPLRVYYACYLVLDAANDPGAATILETAYGELQARAENIRDAAVRDAFLSNVESNRLIARAWELASRRRRS